MGNDIFQFFKKNSGKYYEVLEIAKIIDVNKQTAYSQVKKMYNQGHLRYKEVDSSGNSPPKKVYSYVPQDDEVTNAFKQLIGLSDYKELKHMRQDDKLLLLLLTEIRKLREDIKNRG